MSNRTTSQTIFLLIPTIGILGFVILYFISTFYYPGGSYAHRDAPGFSWMHNYWCNMMDVIALNGEINVARPYAISATVSLCLGVGHFYYSFPRYFAMRKIWKRTIQYLGMTSMVFAVFLFTKHHDLVLNIAGVFGFIALVGTLIALRQNKSYRMLWMGAFCVFLIGINNYIYYARVFSEYLPLIQKVTLLFVLSWLIHINLVFLRSTK